MKNSISSVDVRVLARELNELLARARFDKAYSLINGGLRLSFHVTTQGKKDLIVTENFMCVSSFKHPQVKEPHGFAMALRKRLSGGFFESISQHEFDRIIELKFSNKLTLIIELFSKGNIVLLDEDRKIVSIQKRQQWKDRTLKHGEQYEYPPAGENPLELNVEKFKTFLRYSEKNLASAIASLGLGGFTAEEICLKSGFDKGTPAMDLSQMDAEKVYEVFKELLDGIDNGELHPAIILDGESNVEVVAFDSIKYESRVKKSFESFNDAVDEYFSLQEGSEIETERDSKYSKALGKLELMKKKQEENLVKQKEKAIEYKQSGDLIYQHLTEIESLIEQIKKARKEGLSDDEITKKLLEGKEKGVKEAELFKELKKNNLILDLGS